MLRDATDAHHEDDGVDMTLVHWTLGLTPDERLAVLQGFVDSVAALRAATTEAGHADDAAPRVR